MPATKKAVINKKKKVLIRKIKEQTRNAAKVEKRLHKLNKELWKLEIEEFLDKGLLQQLTWEFVPDVQLCNCHATGFRCKEHSSDNKTVQEIRKWIYSRKENDFGYASVWGKTFDGYKILVAIQMDFEDCDEDGCANEGSEEFITLWAIDTEETGTGVPAEKEVLKQFTDKWNIKTTVK